MQKQLMKKLIIFLHNIIWAHYWRAREDIEDRRKNRTILKKIRGKKYYPGYQLDIDHYTKHWMHSNKELLSEEVLEVLKNIYGYEPEQNKYLPHRCSEYQVDLSQ